MGLAELPAAKKKKNLVLLGRRFVSGRHDVSESQGRHMHESVVEGGVDVRHTSDRAWLLRGPTCAKNQLRCFSPPGSVEMEGQPSNRLVASFQVCQNSGAKLMSQLQKVQPPNFWHGQTPQIWGRLAEDDLTLTNLRPHSEWPSPSRPSPSFKDKTGVLQAHPKEQRVCPL